MSSLYRSIHWRFLVLLLCGGLVLPAQARQKNKNKDKEKPIEPKQTHRAEIESDSFDDEHEVHALPDTTLLVVSSKRTAWFGKNDFVLTKYDRQLKQIWQSKQEHKSNHTLEFVAAEPGRIYLLFSTLSHKKLVLYQVNAATGATTFSEHTLPSSNIGLKEMKALDGQVFLSGLDRMNLNMLHLNPREEDIKMLPAVFGMEEDLGEFRVDTLTRAVEYVVTESNGWRSRVQVKRLNTKGEVKGTYFVQPELDYRNDNTLQGARLTPGDTLSKLLLGTFGYRTSIFAKGLYTSDLQGNLKLIDFSKLSYFFEYLSPGGERRMKARFARQEAREKPLILRYRMLLHPVMPHPQGYAIVGEIYYPQYNGNSGMRPSDQIALRGYDPGGSYYNRRMFTGYRFTHAIVCVFDRQGNLLWDNSYKLQNETYPELAPTVEAGVLPDGSVALVYPDEEHIWYKTLKPNTSLLNEEKVEVKTAQENEKMVTSNNEGIIHWYGGNFVAFGFQRIRPEEGSSRTVFYLQNMTFE